MANKKPLKNEKGVALLIALFSLFFLMTVALEVAFDAKVEYISTSQNINRLRARYAAKSGVDLSLLRILIYKKAIAAYGDSLKENKSMLDPIWQFPFAWPPILPKDVSAVSKDMIQKTVKESNFKSQFVTSIESEGSKIDINDLGSDSKSLRESAQKQILQIFQNEMQNNEDFAEKHRDTNFEELVNNIIDWVDENSESLNSGDESSFYEDELQSDFIPPNQPFKTLDELHMVSGMEDDLYELLASRVTVYGTKGVNINYADKDVLSSLDPQLTEEVIQKIMERRNNPDLGGLFQDEDDFINYLGLDDNSFNPTGIPLLFDAEFNFRIISTGNFSNSTKEITAITYDFEGVKEEFIKILDKDDPNNKAGSGGTGTGTGSSGAGSTGSGGTGTGGSGSGGNTPATKKKISPKGRPRVVYWEET